MHKIMKFFHENYNIMCRQLSPTNHVKQLIINYIWNTFLLLLDTDVQMVCHGIHVKWLMCDSFKLGQKCQMGNLVFDRMEPQEVEAVDSA